MDELYTEKLLVEVALGRELCLFNPEAFGSVSFSGNALVFVDRGRGEY